MRLISSLHSGPFSVSQNRPVLGSNVNPNELVAERPPPCPRNVDVDEQLGWERRVERDPECSSLTGAVHTADREEQVIGSGLPVDDPDLTRASFQIPDVAAGREREPGGPVETGPHGDHLDRSGTGRRRRPILEACRAYRGGQ